MEFDNDPAKATINLKKHKVSFEVQKMRKHKYLGKQENQNAVIPAPD